MTDPEILGEVGRRLRRYRLSQDISLLDVADRAGLSKTTVANAEAGRNPTLETIVRILRVLNRLDGLDAFLPPPRISPIDLLERGSKTPRQRASGRTHPGE